MGKNKKNDYFELLTRQTQVCVDAAALLETTLCNFDAAKESDAYDQMHVIEQNGDVLHHDILTKLSSEFITPIDQEDILRLVQIIDDVTDAIDEVTLDFYMYDVKTLPIGADEFSKLVSKCVGALYDIALITKRCVDAFYNAVSELKNFKKPEKLRNQIVEINHMESAADEVYSKAIRLLFTSETDAKTLIGHTKIFDRLEKCCDLCEHAADVMEQIIIKNT